MIKHKPFYVQPGDVFFSSFPQAKLGTLIRWFEQLRAQDFRAEYSHCGIILDSKGTTREILWKVRNQNLYKDYVGAQILVGRYIRTEENKLKMALKDIQKHGQQWYPIHRLFFHALGIARFIHFKRVTCSEDVAKFLWYLGARHKYFWGTNPDTLADEIKNFKIYDTVFEGVLS